MGPSHTFALRGVRISFQLIFNYAFMLIKIIKICRLMSLPVVAFIAFCLLLPFSVSIFLRVRFLLLKVVCFL